MVEFNYIKDGSRYSVQIEDSSAAFNGYEDTAEQINKLGPSEELVDLLVERGARIKMREIFNMQGQRHDAEDGTAAYMTWHKNGQLSSSVQFNNGVKSGHTELYSPDGTLITRLETNEDGTEEVYIDPELKRTLEM